MYVRSGVRVCIASFSRLARSYRRQRLLRLRGESRSSQHSAEWYKDGYIIGDRQLPKSRIIQVGKDVYVVTLRKRHIKKRKQRKGRDKKSNELLRVQGKKSKRKSSVRDIWAPNKRTQRKQKRVKKWVRRNAYKLISRHIPQDMCSSKVEFSGKDISKKLRVLDCSRWLTEQRVLDCSRWLTELRVLDCSKWLTELRVLDCSRWLTELRGSGYGGMLSLFMADRDEQAPLRDHTSLPVTREGNAAGNGSPDGTTQVPEDREGSGNTDGTAPVPNDQEESGNTDDTAPVPNDQDVSGNTDGTAPIPNDQEGAGNTEGTAPIPNDQKGSGNTDGTAPVQNEQKGSFGSGYSEADHPAAASQTQDVCDTSDSQHQSQQSLDTAFNEILTVSVDEMSPHGTKNNDDKMATGVVTVTKTSDDHVKQAVTPSPNDPVRPSAIVITLLSHHQVTQSACNTMFPLDEDCQFTPSATDVTQISYDQVMPSCDAPATSDDQVTPSSSDVPTTSDDQVTPSASDVPTTSDDQVTPSPSNIPTASDDQITPSSSDVPATSDDHVTPSASDVPTTSDDQVTPSASDVPATSDDQVTTSASDVTSTSDDQVTPSASDVPITSDDQVTPSASDVPTTSDDQVTPSASDVMSTSDDQVTPSSSDVPKTSDDQVTPPASDVPTTSDDHVTPSASDVPTTSDDQITPSSSDVPATSDDQVTTSASDVTSTSDDQVTPSASDVPTTSDDHVTPSASDVPTTSDDKVTQSASDVPTASDDQVTQSASNVPTASDNQVTPSPSHVTPTSNNQVTPSPSHVTPTSDDQVTPSGKDISPVQSELNIDYQDPRCREIATFNTLKDSIVLAPAQKIIDDEVQQKGDTKIVTAYTPKESGKEITNDDDLSKLGIDRLTSTPPKELCIPSPADKSIIDHNHDHLSPGDTPIELAVLMVAENNMDVQDDSEVASDKASNVENSEKDIEELTLNPHKMSKINDIFNHEKNFKTPLVGSASESGAQSSCNDTVYEQSQSVDVIKVPNIVAGIKEGIKRDTTIPAEPAVSTSDTPVEDRQVRFAPDTTTNLPVVNKQPHTSVIAARKAAESSSAHQPPLHPNLLETTTVTKVTPASPATKPTKVAPSPEPKRRDIKITAWSDGECSFSTQNAGRDVSQTRAAVGLRGVPCISSETNRSGEKVTCYLVGRDSEGATKSEPPSRPRYDHLSIERPGLVGWLRQGLRRIMNNRNKVVPTVTCDGQTNVLLSLSVIDPSALAEELTMIDSEMLREIEFDEIKGGVWRTSEMEQRSPHVHAMIQFYNNLSAICVTEILSKEKTKDRAHVIAKIIKIAEKCALMNNFNSCKALLSSFRFHVISRLSNTWKKVSRKAKSTKAHLLAQMSSLDDIAIMRRHQRVCLKRGVNSIQFLGDILHQIHYIEECFSRTSDASDQPATGECDASTSTVKDGDTSVVSTVKDGDTSEVCQSFDKGMMNVASNLPSNEVTDLISSNPTENICHIADADLSNNGFDPSPPVLLSNPRQGSCTHDALEDELRQMLQTYQDAAQGYRFSRRPAVKSFLLNATINDPEDNVDLSYGLRFFANEQWRKGKGVPFSSQKSVMP
ncbi:mucin-5AC [Nematostella vectensis]|uniref:mucin-5AC n=1 Tax=Nematostella vectensis TaxID=45351 RepID=UPI002076F80C|nr:mucin-5AC [Nematostella vectensis]